MMVSIPSLTNTKSDLSKESKRFGGTADGGFSMALKPSKSPQSFPSRVRFCLKKSKLILYMVSRLQEYIPALSECNSAGIQNMFCIEEEWEPHRGYVESTVYLHQTKFRGVGRVSQAVI